MPGFSLAIRILFALCLTVATLNYLRADLAHGLLWDYGYGTSAWLGSRILWGALAFIDPLAVVLLFVRPRAGIALTAAIIVADVLHNTVYVALNAQWREVFYLSQVGFLGVVVLLAPLAWRGVGAARRPLASQPANCSRR